MHRGQQLFWIKVNFHRDRYIMLLPQLNACLALCEEEPVRLRNFATCSWDQSLPLFDAIEEDMAPMARRFQSTLQLLDAESLIAQSHILYED